MPRAKYMPSFILMNENNLDFFNAIHKNRRAMGNQNVSTTFKTHKKHKKEYIEARIHFKEANGESKIYKTEVPKMNIFLRLYILNRAQDLILNGSSICLKEHDKEIIEANHEANKDKKKGEPWDVIYNDDQMRSALINLPESNSFKIYEYEKQIFYLKCILDGNIPVVQLRYLYHADKSLFNLYEEPLPIDILFGLRQNTLEEIIHFSNNVQELVNDTVLEGHYKEIEE